jgi:SNF2 family DNA or RNA helicase
MQIAKDRIAHEYQDFARDFALEREYAGLFLAPGLGKTSITLDIVNHIKNKTLIIAPLRIAGIVWPNEIEKWLQFNNIKYCVLHGKNRERDFLSDKYGVYIVNPESLLWLFSMMKKYKRMPWKVLAVDESTKFKNPKSKRFKALKAFARQFKRRYILTGTPCASSLLDLWSQIYLLDFGKALGDTFDKYKRRFFYPVDHMQYDWQPLPGAEEAIRELLKPFCLFIKVEEVLNMPDLIYNDIYVDLPPDVMKTYKQMEDKLFSCLDGYVDLGEDEESIKVIADSAGIAYGKCKQIIQGFMIESLDELQKAAKVQPKTYLMHKAKLEALEDLEEELGDEPLLICYHYQQDLKYLRELMPKLEYIGSGVDVDMSRDIEARWNKGQIKRLAGHPKSMAHGLNLQEAGHHIAFYYLTNSAEDTSQFIGRIWRQGVIGDRVIVHRFIARHTVDEATIDKLLERDDTQRSFLNSLVRYRKSI